MGRAAPRFLPSPFEVWVEHRQRCSVCHYGQNKCRTGLRLEQRWLAATRAQQS